MEATIAQIKGVIKNTPRDLSYLILGSPGIGKTQLSEQLAEELGCQYKVFLSATMDPTDVVGVPHPVGGLTKFLPPEDLYSLTEKSEDRSPTVATFDDLPASNDQVFAALFRLFQQREVGGSKIRDNVMLIATGNRAEDKSAARELPYALSNRFIHFTLKVTEEEWRKWAIGADIEPEILGFMKSRPDLLNTFDPSKNQNVFATPRSVYMASKVQKALGKDHTELALAISGCCGEGWAREYMAFLEDSHKLIPPHEIFANPTKCRVPDKKDIDVMHATIAALIISLKREPSIEKCIAVATYSTRLHVEEMTVILLQDLVNNIVRDDKTDVKDREQIICNEVFVTIYDKYGKYF